MNVLSDFDHCLGINIDSLLQLVIGYTTETAHQLCKTIKINCMKFV